MRMPKTLAMGPVTRMSRGTQIAWRSRRIQSSIGDRNECPRGEGQQTTRPGRQSRTAGALVATDRKVSSVRHNTAQRPC
jgi:hypothetical protein